MKKLFILLSIVSLSYTTKAQVGIGTTSPQADLDIRTSNATSPTAYAGIAIPQVDALPSSGNRAGQMVFLTTNKKYYCYGGSTWNDLSIQTNTAEDVKYGFQTGDHNGWVLLNGRATNDATLSTTQKAQAAILFSGGTLPDARDKFLMGRNAQTLGAPEGSNTVTLTQENLPNVTLTGTAASNGDHTHTYNNYSRANPTLGSISLLPGGELLSATTSGSLNTSSISAHTHTVSVSTGGNATPISTIPSSIIVNTFIYLGN